MKRFFSKASKSFVLSKPATDLLTPSTDSKGYADSIRNGAYSSSASCAGPSLQSKYSAPAVPYPYPFDHLTILACESGLLIRQHTMGEPESSLCVRVAWEKSVKVEEVDNMAVPGLESGASEEDSNLGSAVVVYGIVGILELFSTSILFVITSRTKIGNVIGEAHTVYGVKDVVAIPLVKDRARTVLRALALRNAQTSRPSLFPLSPRNPESEDGNLTPNSMGTKVHFSEERQQIKSLQPVEVGNSVKQTDLRSPSPISTCSDTSDRSLDFLTSPTASVAHALASKLSFWNQRLKRASSASPAKAVDTSESHINKTTTAPMRRSLDQAQSELKEERETVLSNILASTMPPASLEDRNSELEEKIIRECIREFTKGGMYFAYNFDITRSLQNKQDHVTNTQEISGSSNDLNVVPSPESGSSRTKLVNECYPFLPLWRKVDRRFWWNEWMVKPFIDAGLHSYILPIMQGFCQIARFTVPPDPLTHEEDTTVDYAVISRRSKYRAGLRYQRRGIDDDANVANFVETETIARVHRLRVEHTFSFVQVRGSIPLFWTQSSYGLKPPPVLATESNHTQNLEVLKRHFSNTVPLYGPHTVVNLAEQHGKEGPITKSYRQFVQELNSPDVHYCEYDFHAETRGMKYENISKLIEKMEKTFDSQGYFWTSGDVNMSQQKGVFRVNCIDCLDRTNVVQSAFARYALNKQLGAVALLNPQSEYRTEIDVIFNDLWANNGDAISRAYAGTSALKGDFTRTGKRDISGMLNDGMNSLARMYTSTFSDWFSQAVIDFMLGNRTITVFSEFLLKLQSTDPRDLIRLSKIRSEAIATSVSRVLPECERLLSGWTLFAPTELNVSIGDKFEEKVLLLSAKALYIVSYDYTLEKVKLYTRVPLGDIIRITKGAYILSPLEEGSRDVAQNSGFTVTWNNDNLMTRVTSYSVRNALPGTVSKTMSRSEKGRSLGRAPSASVSMSVQQLTRNLTRGKVRETGLSNILSQMAMATEAETTFAAFKALPIDPARVTEVTSSGGEDLGLSEARTCKQAVEMMVECIRKACEDVGLGQGAFVVDEDVVSLKEAQRMTSMYAKMEYGVKRLLWLGG